MTAAGLFEATNAAAIFSTRIILRSSLSVANVHSGIVIKSVAPGGEFSLVAKAKQLFDSIAQTPAGVPNVDGWLIEAVFERQGQIVVALDDDKVAGMLCYHPDRDGNVVIRSLIVDPAYSGMGLATAMISIAVRHAPTVYPGTEHFVCSIRQLPNGDLNEPSRRSFEKLYFAIEPDVSIAYLDGTLSNRAKWPTAELDETGAVYIRYRLMFSQPQTPGAASAFLEEWSNSVLPIPERLRIR